MTLREISLLIWLAIGTPVVLFCQALYWYRYRYPRVCPWCQTVVDWVAYKDSSAIHEQCAINTFGAYIAKRAKESK